MRVQCECCERPAAVIFRPTRFRADDMHKTCDTCWEPVCDDCSDTDAGGIVTCSMCMQTAAIHARREPCPKTK